MAELSGVAQDPQEGDWGLRIVDQESGVPLAGVHVSFPDLSESRVSDSLGVVSAAPGADLLRIVATRVGYSRMDTVVARPESGTMVELGLTRSAIGLPSLTVQAVRAGTDSRELARQMFDREVAIGAVGMTRTEVRAVPTVAENDVFRSLQSVSGVASINDFGAELFVRGGSADQIAVLLDGAPVFGPYHMFGMFSLFNPDIIESAELYKGSIPARYGGSLSGVVSARQRAGGATGTRFSGGLSAVGLRVASDGGLPWADGRWLVAGRKATVDFPGLDPPFSFHDLNLGLHLYPSEEHRVVISLLASEDRFSWDFLGVGESLRSDWANLVSSVTWSWVRGSRITSDVAAYFSRYEGHLAVGEEGSGLATRNRIGAGGVRAQIAVRGEATGVRTGLLVEGGPVSLRGTGPGAYMEGEASGTFLHASAFAEVEHWVGALRLAPGVRLGTERNSGRVFAEPRLSARYHLGPFAISGSLDRSFQFLSMLRDDRHVVPGAPMWFLRGEGQPVSVAEGISVSLDYWRGRTWTGSATGWTRRFTDIPSWHPESVRDLSALEYHSGSAYGWELSLERHAGLLRGRISYQQTRVELRDNDGQEYWPRWDRRHEVDATLTLEDLWGLSASLRTTIGSGTPFWFPAGEFYGLRYDPRGRFLSPGRDDFTILSNVQGRMPYYGRVDFSARYACHWGSLAIVPFLTIPNVTGRQNVLTYRASRVGSDDRRLTPTHQLPLFPFIGVDFPVLTNAPDTTCPPRPYGRRYPGRSVRRCYPSGVPAASRRPPDRFRSLEPRLHCTPHARLARGRLRHAHGDRGKDLSSRGRNERKRLDPRRRDQRDRGSTTPLSQQIRPIPDRRTPMP